MQHSQAFSVLELLGFCLAANVVSIERTQSMNAHTQATKGAL
jgi:hypothetical protein